MKKCKIPMKPQCLKEQIHCQFVAFSIGFKPLSATQSTAIENRKKCDPNNTNYVICTPGTCVTALWSDAEMMVGPEEEWSTEEPP